LAQVIASDASNEGHDDGHDSDPIVKPDHEIGRTLLAIITRAFEGYANHVCKGIISVGIAPVRKTRTFFRGSYLSRKARN